MFQCIHLVTAAPNYARGGPTTFGVRLEAHISHQRTEIRLAVVVVVISVIFVFVLPPWVRILLVMFCHLRYWLLRVGRILLSVNIVEAQEVQI